MSTLLNSWDLSKSLTDSVSNLSFVVNNGSYTQKADGILINNANVLKTNSTYYSFTNPFSIAIVIKNPVPYSGSLPAHMPFLVIGSGEAGTPATTFAVNPTTKMFYVISNNVIINSPVFPSSIDFTKDLKILITYSGTTLNVIINNVTVYTVQFSLVLNYGTPLYLGGFKGAPYNSSGTNWGGCSGLYKGLAIYNSVVGYNEVKIFMKEVVLKINNSYYSFLDSNYDTTTKSYKPLTLPIDFGTYGANIYELFVQRTIDGETFKPIEKFNNFSIVMPSDRTTIYQITGLKSNKQLIVANDDIPISIASNIDSLTLSYNKSTNADIKIIVSIDRGITWKTWNPTTSTFDVIGNLTIPNKSYSVLTDTEKKSWNNTIETILTSGIPVSTFNTLNFNLLQSNYVRFAYALYRPTYSDIAETSELNWQFDAKGYMQKMTDSEHVVNAYEHEIKVTTLISNPLIKVNVMA